MSKLALPPHLRERNHEDWPWPFNRISRGWNAMGPREEITVKDYRPWPPRLVKGKGVARWESSGGSSILYVPDLSEREVRGEDVYGKWWLTREMNPGHPDFLKEKRILIPPWQESRVTDTQDLWGDWTQHCDPDQYSPSALQKFSLSGWMKLYPHYVTQWNVLKKRELPIWPQTGEDTVIFLRRGHRPDHVDHYYNVDRLTPIGYIGLKWE